MDKKFKVTEDDVQWEGGEISTQSKTKIEDDKGSGIPVILRFFDFGANPESFKKYKPTAQELFNHHRKGIESLLWSDGLRPYEAVEPRLMFSKNKKNYRFIIACVPAKGNTLVHKTQTLSDIIHDTRNNTV